MIASRTRTMIGAVGVALLSASVALGVNQNEQRLDVTLAPTPFAPSDAIGDATFTERRYRDDFEVEVEDLPVGTYDLFVNDVFEGAISVLPTSGGTQGLVEFSSAGAQLGKLPLDFDPRGSSVEVRNAGTVLLAGILPAAPNDEAPDDDAEFNKVNERLELEPLDGSRAKGRIKLNSNQSKAKLFFQLQRLEDAPHTITANDVLIAQFDPTRGGAANVKFSTMPNSSEMLLDFDPANTTFRVLRGDVLVFQGETDDNWSIGAGADPVGEIEQSFVNSGPDPDASGRARFRDLGDRFDFEVEIEDLPSGPYDLCIGASDVASISVTPDGEGGTEGEIEFSTASEPGKLPLTFDPRGQTIQIKRDGTTYLSMSFPD